MNTPTKKKTKFVRFTVLVPKVALDYATQCGVNLDIQELTLSAMAGYFSTFASSSPSSSFPLAESRKIAKFIEDLEAAKCDFCPFCFMFSINTHARKKFAKDFNQCSLLSSILEEQH
ncbi:MAG: hypothetical protein ACLFU9_07190 [Candidatus Bathyarchaeia archaeon]